MKTNAISLQANKLENIKTKIKNSKGIYTDAEKDTLIKGIDKTINTGKLIIAFENRKAIDKSKVADFEERTNDEKSASEIATDKKAFKGYVEEFRRAIPAYKAVNETKVYADLVKKINNINIIYFDTLTTLPSKLQ